MGGELSLVVRNYLVEWVETSDMMIIGWRNSGFVCGCRGAFTCKLAASLEVKLKDCV